MHFAYREERSDERDDMAGERAKYVHRVKVNYCKDDAGAQWGQRGEAAAYYLADPLSNAQLRQLICRPGVMVLHSAVT